MIYFEATEKRARTSALTAAGFPVCASIGHQIVSAFASKVRSLARTISVWRSKRMRLAVPTHVLATTRSPSTAGRL